MTAPPEARPERKWATSPRGYAEAHGHSQRGIGGLVHWSDYSSINASANGSFFERYTHAAMEPPWSHGMAFPNVLEVGANRGEHIPYVHHEFHRYIASDIEPPQLLAEVAADPRIEPLACDIAALPARDQTFDRVVVTCVLRHIRAPTTPLSTATSGAPRRRLADYPGSERIRGRRTGGAKL